MSTLVWDKATKMLDKDFMYPLYAFSQYAKGLQIQAVTVVICIVAVTVQQTAAQFVFARPTMVWHVCMLDYLL